MIDDRGPVEPVSGVRVIDRRVDGIAAAHASGAPRISRCAGERTPRAGGEEGRDG